VIYLRIKRVRSDFVGRILDLIRGREFITLDTFMTGDPDECYGKGNG